MPMTNDELVLLTELKLSIQILEEKVDRIAHVLLEGNGKPALTEQVLTVVHRVDRLEEDRKSKEFPRAAWVGILVPTVLSIIGLAMSVS